MFGATLGAAYQCILLTAAFGTVLLLLAAFKPFAHTAATLVGLQSLMCLLLSAQAALAVSLLGAEGPGENSAAANGVAATVLCVNVVFVLSFVWRVVRVIDWRFVAEKVGHVAKAAALGCSKSITGKGSRRLA